MKKKTLITLLLVITVLAATMIRPEAKVLKKYDNQVNNTVENVVDGSNVAINCDPNGGGLFTPEAVDIINELLDYFRFLTPAVLIVMIGADLTAVVMSAEHMPGGKDDSMRKAYSRIIRRLLAAVLLFFIPTFIRIILNLDGVRQAITIDSSCVDIIK